MKANYGKAMAYFGKLWQDLVSSGNVCQILLKFVKKTVYICTYIRTHRHQKPQLFRYEILALFLSFLYATSYSLQELYP